MQAIEVTIASLHRPRPDDAAVGERDALHVQVVAREGLEGSLRDELCARSGESDIYNAERTVENSSYKYTKLRVLV